MPIFLGLDLGEKRVGVARSDEMGIIAEATATLTYKGRKNLLKQLQACLDEFGPEKIIVGFPRTLRNEVGPAAEKVAAWVEWLKNHLPGEWILWDERFSTVEAERVLLEADLSRKKRREVRDQLAAQRILQSYLDAQRIGG